jgi:putative transposase
MARAYASMRNSRRTFLHQVSAKMVHEHDLIAIEQLNVKALADSMLSKSIRDAAWSVLYQMIAYKAEGAGRKLEVVNPRHTSQTCPQCGRIDKKKLSERLHSCSCGCILDRDVAAAMVILNRAVMRPGLAKLLDTAA